MSTPSEEEARAEAERRWPIHPHGVTDTRDVPDLLRFRAVFEQGAMWAASRVSTPPSEIAVSADQIRSRLSSVRAYYDATWATRELAAPSAAELIWVLTGEEAWGEAYLDREYEPPVPAVPVLPTEPSTNEQEQSNG